jgi:hypothetical protein
VIDPFL